MSTEIDTAGRVAAGRTRRPRGPVVTGVVTTLGAVAATTVAAAPAPVTVVALVGLHLIPAAVMIPALTRSLRVPVD